MKANDYAVMVMAVDAGVCYGWNRAHKHTANPSEDLIKDSIVAAVQDALCEWFTFEGPNSD